MMNEEKSKVPALTRKKRIFVFVFGVLTPIIALIVELDTGFYAQSFFDPIPTFLHIVLVVFVPLANLAVLIAVGRNYTKYFSALAFANGIAIGISLIYMISCIPIYLSGIIYMLLIIGIITLIGFLLLAPLTSVISALICRNVLNEIAISSNIKIPKLWYGFATGLVLFAFADLSSLMTYSYMKMAASGNSETQARAIMLLRRIGSENTMIRICYGSGSLTKSALDWLILNRKSRDNSQFREVYYRVTGIPFNAVPPPKSLKRSRPFFDNDLGTQTVSGKVQGLSLSDSRIDGFVYADAGIGYTEWTLVFKNTSPRQQEARTQILLPPGSVVSRLTLWVDGEEREAAFSAKKKVREAYTRVVSRRRDPVLVTASGPDRAMVQCFPVPAGGGEMKIRFGITSPLNLQTKEQGIFLFPCFLENNFIIPENFQHSVWVESEKPVSSNKYLNAEHPQDDLYAVRGMIKDSELSEAECEAALSVPAETWTPDSTDMQEYIIRQTVQETGISTPPRIVAVVDGSKGMRKHISAIAEVFTYLPEQTEFRLVFASDIVAEIENPAESSVVKEKQNAAIRTYQHFGKQLRRLDFVGGQDNIPALARAWDIAAEKSGSVVVWIHGPQPLILQRTEILTQIWERRPGSVRLFDVQVEDGPNQIIEKLEGIAGIESARISGLKNLFSVWSGKQKQIKFLRQRYSRDEFPDLNPAQEATPHLARLWAYNRILNLYASKSQNSTDEAIDLAMNYQLVTPVSGAVVLETEQQYKDAGLKPVDPNTTPEIPVVWDKHGGSSSGGGGGGIPEPATLWLMITGLITWAFCRRKRK